MEWKSRVRSVLRKTLGWDLRNYNAMNSPTARRMLLLQHYGVNTIYDVGANEGQYVEEMRDLGYRGRFVSFEPLSGPFRVLAAHARRDPQWEAEQIALGEASEQRQIHVAEMTACSSLLDVMPRSIEAAPKSAFVGTEEVEVQTFDEAFGRHHRPGDRPFLKIDVQGYEQQVLDGAQASLSKLMGVQMEISLVPLYEGSASFSSLLHLMESNGFRLMSFEPVFADMQKGQMLQIDGVFMRDEPSQA